ncbi:prephenate dehydrogenase [Anaerocolumna xylanovorans]|uniref:Prephenate dehydrogenase n=1 Tax=Anaerocolumna xylanovorans DSM 12503 TaxID=1121345 RepID=A0A1M7Y0B2_9FIRM|nr:prephenate dehydrogenase [Anaerocolumna xylanovorans]SHO45025.1 prephenate dehydrogenase [Anaerocolumna xylanovorans DSM 12503]
MNDLVVGFIGFGLIGGSLAHALREQNPKHRLIAYYYNKNKVNSGLTKAVQDGVLDDIVFDLECLRECDLLFLCAPVLSNISYLSKLKNIVKTTCIITDVGSVKGNICKEAVALGLGSQFVGGHPMAGSEKTGYTNSSSRLLENAYYILTPTKETKEGITEILYSLIKSLGSIPVILSPSEHDDITAAISHVPHIIAACLVNMVKKADNEDKMKTLAAGGFKDITRIASSSPVMWQNICLTNTDSILHFLDNYIDSLNEVKDSLSANKEEAIFDFFQSAGEYRDSIPNTSTGLLNKVYELYLDINDETGAIATVATLLATNLISIKNIGIIHNREFEEGVLRIEFYNQNSCEAAALLLRKHNYTVYER